MSDTGNTLPLPEVPINEPAWERRKRVAAHWLRHIREQLKGAQEDGLAQQK